MKKKILISLLFGGLLITTSGCNNKNNTEKDNKIDNTIPIINNKKLVCSYKEDIPFGEIRNFESTFIFDKEGKKLETIIYNDYRDYKGGLETSNVKEFGEGCNEIDSYKGLSCTFEAKNDNKNTNLSIEMDIANLGSEGRELIEEEYTSDLEKFSLEEVKKYMEDKKYTCRVE